VPAFTALAVGIGEEPFEKVALATDIRISAAKAASGILSSFYLSG
jgi:hypothetical protein